MKKLIYYVEDDPTIAEGVRTYLEDRGFCVRTYQTAQEAKAVLNRQLPALLLMDVNLPDEDGTRLCRWVRRNWEDLPVIFLTVRTDTADIVRGFGTGADDYVGKPFELEVLYSRICALLRRVKPQEGKVSRISCGAIVLDPEKLRVFCEGEEVMLSAMEYQLLLSLMQNKNHTLLRSRLLETIWDANGNFVNDNTLTVTMKRLREKLHDPACMKTVRSFGYRMEDEMT